MKFRFLLLCIIWFTLPAPSMARNLAESIGVGATLHDFKSTQAISVRYHFNKYLSTTLLLGFDTGDSDTGSIFGLKILRNVHLKENINFYIGAGLYLLSAKDSLGASTSGFGLDAILGTEFFLNELPSLGLSFETGISLRTPEKTQIKSFGTTFAGGGIHYYF